MIKKALYTVLSQIAVEGELFRPAAEGQPPVTLELTETQAAYPLQRGAIELAPTPATAAIEAAAKPAKPAKE